MPFEPRYEDRTPLAPFPDDPPLAFLKADNMRPLWTRSSHVIWSARKLGYVDELLLSLYTDAGDVDSLHEEDQTSRRTALPLNASQTLPAAYRQAFDVMGGALSRVWALNEEMTSLVNSAAAQMASSPAKDSPLIGAHVR